MKNFNSVIERINTASNFNDAITILIETLHENGYQHYFFSQLNTNSSPAIFKVKHYETSYSDEWMEIYTNNTYVFTDPVAKCIMSNIEPFYWSEKLSNDPSLMTPEAMDMMQHAVEHQICDGMGFSYLRNQGNLFTLTVSKKEMITDYDRNLLAQMYLVGASLVNKFEEKETQTNDNDITLSRQEQTIVTLAAIGKTDGEIGDIIGLSVNTIRYHWKNLFEKLNSYNRVFAIITAINMGFVDTSILELTTETGSSQKFHKNVG